MSTLRLLFTTASLAVLASCSRDTPAPTGQPAGNPPPAALTSDLAAMPTPEIVAKLEKADAADGKTDKVVEKCAGCSLGMNGSAAHQAKVGGYTLYFCDHCADGKAKEPLKVLAELSIK